MKITKSILIILGVISVIFLSCDHIFFEKYTVSATLVKNHTGEFDVANVIIGKVNVDIPVYMDNFDYSDSASFPANVEPVSNAVVKIGDTEIPMSTNGIYSKADMSLEYKQSYSLSITIGDTLNINSEAVVPDSFSIITPADNDTVGIHGVEVVWHRSDSASFYVVYVDDAEDSVSLANGYENVVKDTSVVLPDSCFMDLDGNPIEGVYKIHVFAVNGAWKHGILSFILGGGNVHGAWGTYAIMTPSNNTVRFNVRNRKKK